MTWDRSTAPTSTGAGSSRTSCRAATISRSASTSSPTWNGSPAVAVTGPRVPTPATTAPEALPAAPERSARTGKSLTIGVVCKLLKGEFSDISISKIRYLEDQKLLTPRRTGGGSRLYSPADVARLRTILRLQRDEFLPLRVIRQELAAGRDTAAPADGERTAESQSVRRTNLAEPSPQRYELAELMDYTGVDERLVRELEEYRVI